MSARKPSKAFDRDAWATEKAAKVAAAKAALEEGLRALQTSDDWTNLLTRVARSARHKFRVSRYSFTNQILVAMQSQGEATMSAGFAQWKSVGRSVKKGEKSMVIIQPRPWTKRDEKTEEVTGRGMAFGTAAVFAYDQTEGEEIAPLPKIAEEVPADSVFASTIDALRGVAMALEGAPVSSIAVRARAAGDPKGALGWFVPLTGEIVVIDSGNGAQMFKTLAHEIAHSIMHGTDDHHGRDVQEVEAESVAFIVAHAVGLNTAGYSFPYVASWAGKGKDAAGRVQESGERIVRAASVMIDALYPQSNAVESEREAA